MWPEFKAINRLPSSVHLYATLKTTRWTLVWLWSHWWSTVEFLSSLWAPGEPMRQNVYQQICTELRDDSHSVPQHCFLIVSTMYTCPRWLSVALCLAAFLTSCMWVFFFFKDKCQVKRSWMFDTAQLINVSFKTVDQSEETRGRTNISKNCSSFVGGRV